MGRLAAEHLLNYIAGGPDAPFLEEVMIEPELIVRQSTMQARKIDAEPCCPGQSDSLRRDSADCESVCCCRCSAES
jgi:hypothetical protein